MFYVLQNESTAARRRVPILLTDAATGTTAQTGVATTTIFPYVAINGNAFIGGTGSLGEAGFGQYYYEFEANEVATLGLAGIHITAAGCRDYDAIAQIAALDFYSANAGGGISAYDVWNYVLNLSGQTAEYQLDTAALNSTDANNRTMTIETQTLNISNQVWSDDLGAGANSPYAAGTAGTILYTLGQGGTALTAGDVWDYASRTITGGIADTVQLVATPVDITTSSMSGIANTVWSTDVSGYTSPSAGFDLTQAASGGSGITAGDVWDFSITGFGDTNSSAYYLTNTLFTSGNIETYVQNQTPQDIWSYAGIEGRTITGGLADTVTTLTNRSGFAITGGTVDTVTNPVSLSTASMTGIAGTVWNSLTASYTANNTFGNTILRSDAGNTVGNVTLRSAGGINMVDADVHRIDNDVDAATNLKLALTGIGASWTGNIAGTVVDVVNPVDVSTTSMSGIANTVWSTDVSGYASPSAGYDLSNATAGGGITAGDVWNYTLASALSADATITQIDSNISVLPANSASAVWSYILGNAVDADTNLVNAASGAGLTSGDIWSYGTRTITGGIADTVTTITDRSGFAITGGTITTVSDKTGYSLSGSQSFNLTGNITGNVSGSVGSVTSPVTVGTNNDKTGYALSAGGVTAVQSGLSTLTQAQVGTEVDASLADVGLTTTVTGRIDATISSRLASSSYTAPPTEAAIAGTVWSYNSRTLTSAAGATAGDVWTYPTRSLTSGAGITVNAATNIINGPYFVKSNVDSQDGNLDVIKGMVQDIQLTVTDAFQNPFDVTALGLAVNFYDQAGTLVTSYGTSNLYAPAGLVQFTLDTAVTANEGRYNLILSAAGSGNTIKFGPLQTLVRPF